MPQMFLSLKTLAEFDNGLASELWQGALEAAIVGSDNNIPIYAGTP